MCLCSSVECSAFCMRTLLKLLHHHVIYKDVFREVGLIEVMVTCLQRYAALLKDSDSGSGTSPSDHYCNFDAIMMMLIMLRIALATVAALIVNCSNVTVMITIIVIV